jgi:AbrB family looped-hinge helix DNA binding protein
MDIAITRISSKGQVVIPAEMRGGLKEGDKIVIIKNDKQLIMKKATDMDSALNDDIIFAKRTEDAYQRYLKGGFKEMDSEGFLKELKKW